MRRGVAVLTILCLLTVVTSQSTDFIPCTGSIAECSLTSSTNDGDLFAEAEFEMDSEINRRILATSRYISYGALKKNTIPCSRRGASYYNCRRGAEANPYSRGCSAITRCRR